MDAAIAEWRKAERARLIGERMALSAEDRAARAQAIAAHLDALIGDSGGRIVSLYWPFRGEPDLRPWLDALNARGARTALPIVAAPRTPLIFRLWRTGEKLERGVWNIPIPAEGEIVQPDIVIAPVVGFDAHCYRLGYGGGFFDRTLPTLPPSSVAIGVGYASALMASIRPQAFDIPLHHVVTEAGVRSRAGPSEGPAAVSP